MSNTVLLATDGSAGGDRALAYSAERAKASGARIVVAYVIEWSPYTFNTPEENAERHTRREQEISRARESVVDPAMKSLAAAGIEAEAVVRHGGPAETLIDLARQHDVAQIVIGRVGGSSLKSLIFGSVTGKLVQASPVPVVVVP